LYDILHVTGITLQCICSNTHNR